MDDKNKGKQAGKPCVLALSAPYSSNASLHQSSARKALPARKLWKSSLLPVWKGRKGKHKNGRTFRRNVPTFSLRPRSSCSVFVYLFWWLQKDSTKAAKFPETTRHWRSPPQLASEVYQSTFSNASDLVDDGNKNDEKNGNLDAKSSNQLFYWNFGWCSKIFVEKVGHHTEIHRNRSLTNLVSSGLLLCTCPAWPQMPAGQVKAPSNMQVPVILMTWGLESFHVIPGYYTIYEYIWCHLDSFIFTFAQTPIPRYSAVLAACGSAGGRNQWHPQGRQHHHQLCKHT